MAEKRRIIRRFLIGFGIIQPNQIGLWLVITISLRLYVREAEDAFILQTSRVFFPHLCDFRYNMPAGRKPQWIGLADIKQS